MEDKFINLQLFGIDYLTCDTCGEGFPDVIDYAYCQGCDKVYCSDECAEEAGVKYTYYNDEGNETSEDGDWYDSEITSCKFCRNEDFTGEQILEYLLNKYKLTVDKIKEEMKENKNV